MGLSGLQLPGVRPTAPTAVMRLSEVVVVRSDDSGVWVGPEGSDIETAERVDFLDQPAPAAGAVAVVARGALGLHLLTAQRPS